MKMKEHLFYLKIVKATRYLQINKSIINNTSQTISLLFDFTDKKIGTLSGHSLESLKILLEEGHSP